MECRRSKRKRPNCPDQDDPANQSQEYHAEDFAEVIKFCGLSKEDNETMSDYYRRLKLQADKSGVNCCQDRIIRDRLIQAVTDKDILLELAKMTPNPTAKDVLDKYNDIQRDSKLFQLVLPWVSILDLSALSRTSFRMQKIVDSFMRNGNPITFDNQLILKYPIEKNKERYLRFKQATHVTLKGVSDSAYYQYLDLHSYFQAVQIFTIVDMVFNRRAYEDQEVPLTKEINMINVKMDRDMFELWLSWSGIKKVNLENVHIGNVDYTNGQWIKLSLRDQTQIEHLQIKGDRIILGSEFKHLISLKVVAKEFWFYYLDSIRMKSVTLDISSPECVVQLIEECYKYGGNLETLSLVRRIDPKYKNCIDKFWGPMPKVNVEYNDYAGPDQVNQILNVLNDTCLVHLTRFLGLVDCIALSETCSKFKEIIVKHRFLKYDSTIDPGLTTLLKTNPDFIKSIAPYVKDLRIRKDTEQTLKWLPMFRALDTLEINNIYLNNNIINRLPTNIRGLHIRSGRFPVNSFASFLLKFGNLREFLIDSSFEEKIVEKVLQKNKFTLEHIILVLGPGSITKCPSIDWNVLQQMPNFKHLTYEQGTISNPRCDWSCKQKISILLESMFSVVGHRLKKLTIDLDYDAVETVINGAHLVKLQELELCQLKANVPIRVGNFPVLKKVTLEIPKHLIIFKSATILMILNGCPLLDRIISSGLHLDVNSDLGDFLAQTGRKLTINGVLVK